MRSIVFFLVGVLACALPASGRDAPSLPDQIIRESDRQVRVSAEMARLLGDMAALVNDVRSNHVFSEAEGNALVEMSDAIRQTDKRRVRVAAEELSKAAASLPNHASHIDTAGTEIETAVVELTNLLRRANALQIEVTIAQEIRDLLRQQQRLAQQSAQIGREMLQDRQPSIDPESLAREQEKLARRTQQLQQALEEALKEELTEDARRRMQQAAQVAQEKKPSQRMQNASAQIARRQMIPAADEQRAAMDALQEMLNQISDAEPPLSERDLEALRNLLERQKELRQQTEGMKNDQFQKNAPDLQLAQINLNNMLPEEPPATSSDLAQLMERAAQALGQMKQDEAVAAQMAAEAALAQAMQQAMGPGPGVPGAKGQKGTDDKGDGDGDKDKEGRGKGKGEGKGKAPGPPKDGETEGQPDGPPQAQVATALARNRPGSRAANPRPGDREFAPSRPGGTPPQDDSSTWTSLRQDEREALNESFARELPREYRDMLKAYFEQLSK